MLRPETRINRFWSKVEKTPVCWLYHGSKAHFGYGVLFFGKEGREVRAHRFAWELLRGPIPAGLWVLHRCDVPSCVNPDHLFLGTAKDNTADMIRKGRANVPRGSRHGSVTKPWAIPRGAAHWASQHVEFCAHGDAAHGAKLTWPQADAIKELLGKGVSRKVLADRFGVSYGSIGYVARGQTWKMRQVKCARRLT